MVLSDPGTTIDDKVDLLVNRLVKVGLMWPNPETVGRIVATAMAAGLPAEDHAEFYDRVTKLTKQLHKQREGVSPAVMLQKYPDTVQQLPAKCRKAT